MSAPIRVDPSPIVFDALANRHRRTVLSILREGEQFVRVSTLADALVARTESDADGDADRDAVLASLRHLHLPMLEAAELLTYDTQTNTVHQRSDRSQKTTRLVNSLGEADDPRESLLEGLAHPHRRLALSVLAETRVPLSPADLATRVVARERDIPLFEVSASAHERLLLSLQHQHLPMLAHSLLVDHSDDHVTLSSSLPLDEPWANVALDVAGIDVDLLEHVGGIGGAQTEYVGDEAFVPGHQ